MTHQLENIQLQEDIRDYLVGNYEFNNCRQFFNFINNQEYELAEQICRHFHKDLSKFGYILTEGRVITYLNDFVVRHDYYVKSDGMINGLVLEWNKHHGLEEYDVVLDDEIKTNHLLKQAICVIKELTDKQRDLLNLLCLGYTKKEIANILKRSPYTIETNVTLLLRKFNAKNTTHLVALYSSNIACPYTDIL